jgi:hypothetical protein
MRFAAELEMKSPFVPHLCHDVGGWSQPGHHRPMRDFVPSQILIEVDQDPVERYFGPARDVISKLSVNLRPSRGRPRAQTTRHAQADPL